MAVQCPNCGASNLEDQRFCGKCGAALDPSILGSKAADQLLFTAWSELKPDDVVMEKGAAFARKLLERDSKHRAEIKALFDQRGLKKL